MVVAVGALQTPSHQPTEGWLSRRQRDDQARSKAALSGLIVTPVSEASNFTHCE